MPETVVVNHTDYPLPPAVRDWPGIRLVECPNDGAIPPEVSGEVVLTRTNVRTESACRPGRDGSEWVHVVGTGVDSFPFDALQGQGLHLFLDGMSGDAVSASGVHAGDLLGVRNRAPRRCPA